MHSINTIKRLLKMDSAAGIILAFSTVFAFMIANSDWDEIYSTFLSTKIFSLSIQHWINDGLMALFFFVVGLEIKKEIVKGELSSLAKASFPIAGALGGMILPALIYLYFNNSIPESKGWGIPMATDIAFALSVLTLFNNRVPPPLKIFLLALAIVDDLGAVLVIALFYSAKISWMFLFYAGIAFLAVYILQQLKVKSYLAYSIVGLAAWSFVLLSGVHATLAGVTLGIMTPTQFAIGNNRHATYSPTDQLIHFFHPWISFLIMPIFAFANAGLSLKDVNPLEMIQNEISQGVFWGLVVGKPLGISLLTYLFVKLRLASLPFGVNWKQILGVSSIAGMGFTMSLFISSLALPIELEPYSKGAILIASIVSGLLGALILYWTLPRPETETARIPELKR